MSRNDMDAEGRKALAEATVYGAWILFVSHLVYRVVEAYSEGRAVHPEAVVSLNVYETLFVAVFCGFFALGLVVLCRVIDHLTDGIEIHPAGGTVREARQ